MKKICEFVVQALTDRREGWAREEFIRNHLAQVTVNDPMLAAVRELLALKLLESAAFAGSHASDDTTKLRSCERLEFARCFLLELETRLEDARAWRAEQERAAG